MLEPSVLSASEDSKRIIRVNYLEDRNSEKNVLENILLFKRKKPKKKAKMYD